MTHSPGERKVVLKTFRFALLQPNILWSCKEVKDKSADLGLLHLPQAADGKRLWFTVGHEGFVLPFRSTASLSPLGSHEREHTSPPTLIFRRAERERGETQAVKNISLGKLFPTHHITL